MKYTRRCVVYSVNTKVAKTAPLDFFASAFHAPERFLKAVNWKKKQSIQESLDLHASATPVKFPPLCDSPSGYLSHWTSYTHRLRYSEASWIFISSRQEKIECTALDLKFTAAFWSESSYSNFAYSSFPPVIP